MEQATYKIFKHSSSGGCGVTRVVFSTNDKQEAKDVFECMYNACHRRIGSFCERSDKQQDTSADNDGTLDVFYADYGTSWDNVWLQEELC